MNTIEIILAIMPICFSLLSLISSIFLSVLSGRVHKNGKARKEEILKISIMLNRDQSELNEYNKDEILKVVSKAIDENKFSIDVDSFPQKRTQNRRKKLNKMQR